MTHDENACSRENEGGTGLTMREGTGQGTGGSRDTGGGSGKD